LGEGGNAAAIPLFQRAIGIDPSFAAAYNGLGVSYLGNGESSIGRASIKKSYDLRGRVSELEKFHIESNYHHFVSGDLEKARQTYELWAQPTPEMQPRMVYLVSCMVNSDDMKRGLWKPARLCALTQ
jgi:eukaryotic-like serine/threonine-protein kinase